MTEQFWNDSESESPKTSPTSRSTVKIGHRQIITEPLTRDIDIEWAKLLCKQFRDELGAVHLGVLEALATRDEGRVRVARGEGQLVGVICTRKRLASDPRITPIIAAAVPTDLQRMQFCLTLLQRVEQEAAGDGRTIIQAICRYDLPSNRFWAAAGFIPAFARFSDSTRGKPAIVWRKRLQDSRIDLFERIEPKRPQGPGGRYLPKIIPGEAVLFPGMSSPGTLRPDRYEAAPSAVGELLTRSPITSTQVAELMRLREASILPPPIEMKI